MNCKHQFIHIEQLNRRPEPVRQYEGSTAGSPISPGEAVWRDEYGARVGCPICGEIREVWANGEVIILVKGQYHDDPTNSEKTEDRASQSK